MSSGQYFSLRVLALLLVLVGVIFSQAFLSWGQSWPASSSMPTSFLSIKKKINSLIFQSSFRFAEKLSGSAEFLYTLLLSFPYHHHLALVWHICYNWWANIDTSIKVQVYIRGHSLFWKKQRSCIEKVWNSSSLGFDKLPNVYPS